MYTQHRGGFQSVHSCLLCAYMMQMVRYSRDPDDEAKGMSLIVIVC